MTEVEQAVGASSRRPISRRLLTLAALALLASIASGLVITFELVLVNERSSLDRALRQQALHFERDVLSTLGATAGGPPTPSELERAVGEFAERESGTRPVVTLVVLGGDRFVGPSDDGTLNALAESGGIDASATGDVATIHTKEGDLRALRTPVLLGEDQVGALVVAGSMDPVRWEAFAALQRLLLAGGVSLVVGLGLMWLAIRRVIGPLGRLRDAVAATDPSDLHPQVNVEGDDEIADLATEFNALLDRLSVADAEREEMLATIAHEIRTPLAVAQGRVEMARTQLATGDAVRHELDGVTRELNRSNRLVRDLLALGRSGHPGFIERRPVSVRHFMEDVEIRAEGQGFEMVSVVPAPDVTVNVDSERLHQAVANCIANAVHHNPPGTEVVVSARVDPAVPSEPGDGELVLTVSDDGVGIPEEDRSRVFEAFVTSTSERLPTHSSGLGLAVVAAVVTSHGGNVGFLDGPGTTVEMRIPVPGSPAAR